jgi:outer membrane biosynthesis protein TonB
MPQDIHVVKSFRPDFDAQAVKAAKQDRFRPALLSGEPVAVSIKMQVNFK